MKPTTHASENTKSPSTQTWGISLSSPEIKTADMAISNLDRQIAEILKTLKRSYYSAPTKGNPAIFFEVIDSEINVYVVSSQPFERQGRNSVVYLANSYQSKTEKKFIIKIFNASLIN